MSNLRVTIAPNTTEKSDVVGDSNRQPFSAEPTFTVKAIVNKKALQ